MNPSETTAPFSKSGVKIHWADILKVLAWLVPVLLAAAMLYLASVFVTHAQLEAAFEPLAKLPSRVEYLEEFKTDQKQQQSITSSTVNLIQQDISGMKAEIRALKDESTRNTDRILQRLDSIRKDQ